MKRTNKQIIRLTALSAALAAAYGPAQAQDEGLKALITPQSSISVGVGTWSKDRPQQGTYDGMRENVGYGLLDFSLSRRESSTGTWLNIRGSSLGLDTRELGAEWLRQGDMGVSLEYSRIPRTNPWTFNTGLQGIGSTNMVISGSGANARPLQPVTLETERDRFDLGFTKHLIPGLEFKASFKNEDKDGARPYGLGSQPLFLVEPISYNTRQLELTLKYTKERLQLNGGYYASWFENSNKLLWGQHLNMIGTSQGATSNPNPVPLSQPLNNQSHQFNLNGGYSFTKTTRATFKLSYGNATQDEQLPTRGLTGVNAAFAGAPSNLNGKITTTLAEVALTSRPMPQLSIAANLRYHDVNDKTPLAVFVNTGTTVVHNTPHSIKTTSGKLEASYRLPQGFTLTGGVDLKNQDRTFPQFQGERYVPFRADLDETTYRVQLRRGLTDTVNGSLAFLHSKRKGSSYTLSSDTHEDHLSPFYVADRKRDAWRASIDWTPTDALGFNFNLEEGKDKYGGGREFGRKDGKATLYSADATYAVNDKFSLSAWYSHDETKSDQHAGRWTRSSGLHELDRTYRLKDKGDSFGFGARGVVMPKFTLGANLQWAKNNSTYDESIVVDPTCVQGFKPAGSSASTPGQDCQPQDGGAKADLQPITSKLTRLHFWGAYDVQKNGTVRVEVIHEKWKTDDWTWSFANGTPFSYGQTTDGTTVTMNPNQKSTFVGARYIYRFQ